MHVNLYYQKYFDIKNLSNKAEFYINSGFGKTHFFVSLSQIVLVFYFDYEMT